MNRYRTRTSLSGSIVESLKKREMISDLKDSLLEGNCRRVCIKNETEYWDYKEILDLNNPISAAELAKDIIGFHNSKGGVIVVGVTDNFRPVGILSSSILDTVRLNGKLRKYFSENIPIFQDQIFINSTNKSLWLIFIPQKEGNPVKVAKNGPDKKGRPVIKKGTFYFRVDDEVKPCIDPSDFAVLFTGQEIKNLHAYQYDIDEPFFRLLAPHCEHFFGRKELVEEIYRSLGLRQPIICLDGVGGVGKSAIAIELLQHLYNSKKYDFIISLSAKNRIWNGYSGARKAAFTGITELLQEIAGVLGINIHADIETLKKDIISFIDGTNGIFLIDNLEEIQDMSVFRFLSEEIPDPVKVLVTSRIDRSLGAKVISIPAMKEEEAADLLEYELKRVGVTDFLGERKRLKEILTSTGGVPLAIKWAASLAGNEGSLARVSHKIRSFDTTKREFLDFCFSSMFDALSSSAKDTALLCPYLGEEWNNLTVSIALNKPVTEIDESIKELQDKGLILASMPGKHQTYSVLPLTMDYLSNKWHENKELQKQVRKKIADQLVSDSNKDVFGLGVEERAGILLEKARVLEQELHFDDALKLLRLALQWVMDDKGVKHLIPEICFAEGRVLFQTPSKKHHGITLMAQALKDDPNHKIIPSSERFFLAEALIDYGKRTDEEEALEILVSSINHKSHINQSLIKKFCGIAISKEKTEVMTRFLEKIREEKSVIWVAHEIFEHVLKKRQTAYEWGHDSVARILSCAGNSEHEGRYSSTELLNLANELTRKKIHSN